MKNIKRKIGSGIYIKSEEHKRKLSEANKGNKPWNTGIKGEEYFAHLKEGKIWNKGMKGDYHVHSKEHKELIKKGFKVLRLWEFEIRSMDVNQFEDKLMEIRI